MNQQEKILLNFYNTEIINYPNPEFSWMNGRSYSEKFVICVGAGPWKFGRRKKIQGDVLAKLNGRDLTHPNIHVNNYECKWYPLTWQNLFVECMKYYLLANKITMDQYCEKIIETNDRHHVYKNTSDSGKYTKVISLFCRDGLGIDAFPIDRHVKRKLEELNLPANEDKLIDMCRALNLKPAKVATLFVRTASEMDNPDWSIK